MSFLRRHGLAVLTASSVAVAAMVEWVRLREGQGDALDRMAMALQIKPEAEPRFQWKSIAGKHWQAVATNPSNESLDETDAKEGTRGNCSPGMVAIAGQYKLDSFGGLSSEEVELLQNKTCTHWINREFPARCGEFSRDSWLPIAAKLPSKPLRFCIDRFEYPNVKGENPIIVATYTEATAMCRASGKRLCSEAEWTFACEGEEAMPYPYGYARDAEACVVDQSWRPFAEGALFPRDGDNAREELDRLWQGQPSGSRPKCKSPAGVYDLTGNVDEWTRSTRSEGYASILKGGYWGPVRARCRASTRAHDEGFVAYQQSFRCCADAKDAESNDAGAVSELPAPNDAGLDAQDLTKESVELDAGASANAPLAPDSGATAITDAAVNVGLPAVLERAERLVLSGVEAGALAPELRADDLDVLNQKRKTTCSFGTPTEASWVLLAVLVACATRKRVRVVSRARRHSPPQT
jgi:formylglycine-generating enzyme